MNIIDQNTTSGSNATSSNSSNASANLLWSISRGGRTIVHLEICYKENIDSDKEEMKRSSNGSSSISILEQLKEAVKEMISNNVAIFVDGPLELGAKSNLNSNEKISVSKPSVDQGQHETTSKHNVEIEQKIDANSDQSTANLGHLPSNGYSSDSNLLLSKVNRNLIHDHVMSIDVSVAWNPIMDDILYAPFQGSLSSSNIQNVGEHSSSTSNYQYQQQCNGIPFWNADILMHFYRYPEHNPDFLDLQDLIYNDNDNEEEENEMDDNEGSVSIAHLLSHQSLPSKSFQGLWENLLFDDGIKERLLQYSTSTLLFSEKKVNPNIISWNRVVSGRKAY